MSAVKSSGGRRWIAWVVFAALLIVAAIGFRTRLVAWFGGAEMGSSPSMGAAAPSASAGRAVAKDTGGEVDHYTCSMHPSVHQHGPGKCPICGMDLLPVSKEQQAQGVVLIDEARRQLIGVRTSPVIEGPSSRRVRAVGHVAYDESTLTDVNLKVSGWITKLVVSKTGQRVTAGQTLFLFYSPELYNAQQDFLLSSKGAAALATAGAAPSRPDSFGHAARQRLHLLGMSEGQIVALEKRGTASESVAVPAPASGFVIEKDVVEGASVEAGMRLFRIAALDKVWVEAELYEADFSHVKIGQAATITLDYLPGRSYDAKVAYVYPYLDPTARTGRVRVELANKALELRPGMYASVELTSAAESHVQVPAAAVVYTGPRRLVFVDLGEGRFRPQEVRVGSESNGMYEVLSGVSAGDVVATSGVFLIAAEARISTAAKYWDKAPDASTPVAAPPDKDAAMPPPPPPPVPMPKPSAMPPRAHEPAPASPAAVFSCPMHPEVRSSSPGQCPKCGMNLERIPNGDTK